MKKYLILGIFSTLIGYSGTEVTVLAQGSVGGFQSDDINNTSVHAGIHTSLGKVIPIKKYGINVNLGTGLEGGLSKKILNKSENEKYNIKIEDFNRKIETAHDIEKNKLEIEKKDYERTIKNFHPYISPFIFAEVNGEVKEDIKLYTGASIGSYHYIVNDRSINKFAIKAKFGATFKNTFTGEISLGYPQYFTIGLGTKFNF